MKQNHHVRIRRKRGRYVKIHYLEVGKEKSFNVFHCFLTRLPKNVNIQPKFKTPIFYFAFKRTD